MDKKDIPLVVLLVLLLFTWPQIQSRFFPPAPAPEQTTENEAETAAGTNTTVETPETPGGETLAPTPGPAIDTPEPPAAPNADVPDPDEEESVWLQPGEASRHADAEPTLVRLGNELLEVTFSTWGGGIEAAMLKAYPQENTDDSEPLVLDFSALPALTYSGIAGLTTNSDFEISADGSTISISATTESGVRLERLITIGDSYSLRVRDVLSNTSEESSEVPMCGISLGPMRKIPGQSGRRAFAYLGVDSQAPGGEKVKHWASKKFRSKGPVLPDFFKVEGQRGGFGGCFKPPPPRPLDREKHPLIKSEVHWAAAKNKFFAQVLSMLDDATADAFTMHARRLIPPREAEYPDNAKNWATRATLEEVAVTLHFDAVTLSPGQSVTREFDYYVGPKKHEILKSLGKDSIMEFGFWSPICQVLLPLLNRIHRMVPNYGWSIIVLTILVRLLFWPVMRKSTESMKRMQDIQPELKELREKYKNDQKKLMAKQQELFRENKVSPLGGCLPMFIQIPVFIGLFTVLRSAVELRFASWLWVSDLSQPEGLLAGVIPFPPYQLNILPILMAATMMWQQKLTPTSGDPQQQKMMAVFMPVMMLFLFYSMPAALVLYWTTSQSLGIVQLMLRNRTDKKKADTGDSKGKGKK